jgi:hypothetical protein
MDPYLKIDPDDPAGCNACSVCNVCVGCWWIAAPTTFVFTCAASLHHDCPPFPEELEPR